MSLLYQSFCCGASFVSQIGHFTAMTLSCILFLTEKTSWAVLTLPWGNVSWFEEVKWWGNEWVFAVGLSLLMDYYPLWREVMKWLFIIATSTCHQTFSVPARPHRHHDKKRSDTGADCLSILFSSSLLITSTPLPSSLPKTNPFSMLSSSVSIRT